MSFTCEPVISIQQAFKAFFQWTPTIEYYLEIPEIPFWDSDEFRRIPWNPIFLVFSGVNSMIFIPFMEYIPIKNPIKSEKFILRVVNTRYVLDNFSHRAIPSWIIQLQRMVLGIAISISFPMNFREIDRLIDW